MCNHGPFSPSIRRGVVEMQYLRLLSHWGHPDKQQQQQETQHQQQQQQIVLPYVYAKKK